MSRRRNGTNRAGAAIGVNRYIRGKLMPRKRKNPTAATVQAQGTKKYHTPIMEELRRRRKSDERKNDTGAV